MTTTKQELEGMARRLVKLLDPEDGTFNEGPYVGSNDLNHRRVYYFDDNNLICRDIVNGEAAGGASCPIGHATPDNDDDLWRLMQAACEAIEWRNYLGRNP